MRSFLQECKKIEEIASKIYQQFAGDKSYAREVRKVFQKLSDDEKIHARQIDLVLQANENEIDVTPMISSSRLDEAVKLAESFAREVEGEILNEEKALQLTVQIEQQFVKFHVQNAMFFRNLKLAELFSKLGKEEEAHLNTLRDCLKWWHSERKPILKRD
jgi:rubrerythrin